MAGFMKNAMSYLGMSDVVDDDAEDLPVLDAEVDVPQCVDVAAR